MRSNLSKFMANYPSRYHQYYGNNGLITDPAKIDCAKTFDLFMRIMSDPVSRIFSGKKRYELRKYLPKHAGLIFLYETDKVQAITGCFYFRDYIAKPLADLWQEVGELATSKERFDAYFDGKEFGVALQILDFEKFDVPITQAELYSRFGKLPRPPQPYVYLYTEVGTSFSKFLRAKAQKIIERNGL